jgi:tetratricopeptide (TPR) repeat protein
MNATTAPHSAGGPKEDENPRGAAKAQTSAKKAAPEVKVANRVLEDALEELEKEATKLVEEADRLKDAGCLPEAVDKIEETARLYQDIADQFKDAGHLEEAKIAYGMARDWYSSAVELCSSSGLPDKAREMGKHALNAAALEMRSKQGTSVASEEHAEAEQPRTAVEKREEAASTPDVNSALAAIDQMMDERPQASKNHVPAADAAPEFERPEEAHTDAVSLRAESVAKEVLIDGSRKHIMGMSTEAYAKETEPVDLDKVRGEIKEMVTAVEKLRGKCVPKKIGKEIGQLVETGRFDRVADRLVSVGVAKREAYEWAEELLSRMAMQHLDAEQEAPYMMYVKLDNKMIDRISALKKDKRKKGTNASGEKAE